MTDYYQIDSYSFYPKKRELFHMKEQLKIRPKTSELLTFLLEANGDIVTKKQILENIWGDVTVDEQVIFQSITELRKLFENIDVIKTHPRKGYSIALDVKLVSHENTDFPDTNKLREKSHRLKKYVLFIMATITVAIISSPYFVKHQNHGNVPHGSVLVLPVTSHFSDSEHHWLKYGGMDHLIQQLNSTENLSVLQTEDVLSILKRADIKHSDYSPEDIQTLFSVTGAALIVEQVVSGSPSDYQLLYSIHQQNKTERGVFIEDEVETAIFKLTQELQKTIGQTPSSHRDTLESDFNNEMFAVALQKIQNEDYDKAIALLQAVVATNQENLAAKRFLVQSMLHNNQFQEAERYSDEALRSAKTTKNLKEIVRISLWRAISLTQQKKWMPALKLLTQSKAEATQLNDWLYLAYMSTISGRIYQAQNNFKKAKAEFHQSIKYHEMILCPFGQASGLIDLGNLALVQGLSEEAVQYFGEALDISEIRNLPLLEKQAAKWLDKARNIKSSPKSN